MSTNKSKKVLCEICMNALRELYLNSTPKADFDKLIENAVMDEEGRKTIPFDDYEIDEQLMIDIVKRHIKENKLNKGDADIIKFNVYLGPSPRTKTENKKNE